MNRRILMRSLGMLLLVAVVLVACSATPTDTPVPAQPKVATRPPAPAATGIVAALTAVPVTRVVTAPTAAPAMGPGTSFFTWAEDSFEAQTLATLVQQYTSTYKANVNLVVVR